MGSLRRASLLSVEPMTADQKRRWHVIDIARGIAVLGVVFNHTIDGLTNAGILPRDSLVAWINGLLYQFRMPALALLLGLFIAGGVLKYGPTRYLGRRLLFAVWTYAVWYVVLSLFDLALNRFKNTPRPPEQILEFWVMPHHLWFLPYLAVSAIIVTLLAPWRSTGRMALALVVATTITIGLWGVNGDLWGSRGVSLIIFTTMGAAFGVRTVGEQLTRRRWLWVGFGVTASSILAMAHYGLHLVPSTVQRPEGYPTTLVIASFIAAGVGVVIVLGLAALVGESGPLARALRFVGQNTMAIYVAHTLFTAGTRVVLTALGVSSPGLHVAAGWAAGVLGTLALAVIVSNLRLDWLFHSPKALEQAVSGRGEGLPARAIRPEGPESRA